VPSSVSYARIARNVAERKATEKQMGFWRTPKQKARDAELATRYPLLWASCPVELRPDMRDMPDATLAEWEAREPERQLAMAKQVAVRAARIELIKLFGQYSDRAASRGLEKAKLKRRKEELGY
jgi:hypothetical protein